MNVVPIHVKMVEPVLTTSIGTIVTVILVIMDTTVRKVSFE